MSECVTTNDNFVFERRKCGFPTKSGEPCKQIVSMPYDMVCGTHRNKIPEDVRQAVFDAWHRGHELGKHFADHSKCITREHELRTQIREMDRKSSLRFKDYRGRQLFTVNLGSGYAYAYSGVTQLQIGDVVRVPGNWVNRYPSDVIIKELGSTYTGEHAEIICVVSRGN